MKDIPSTKEIPKYPQNLTVRGTQSESLRIQWWYFINEMITSLAYLIRAARRSDKTCLYDDDVFIPAQLPDTADR